jgi:mono/diheme cytochrome c family protein
VYTTRCVACHQADAHGLPGVFPPLVGSEWVAGDPTVMIKIVLGGLSGKVTVAGADYDGAMPAWRDQLDDAAIAAVITHERTLAGVQGPPIDAAAVAAVRAATAGRAGPWTEAELGAP